jgi:hypothetical protein
MKKILFGLLILGAIGGVYGYYQWNRKPASMNDKEADAILSATELVANYNEAALLGKVIQVSGKVGDKTTQDGKTSITLDTGDPLKAVIFEMADEAKTEGITVGTDIILRGQCDGENGDIRLSRGVVVK